MQFQNPLYEGRLIQRYKRFLADIKLATGETVTAHCPNPGAMPGLKEPGSRVWVSKANALSVRKYPYTWEIGECDGSLVGINTHLPNRLVEEALLARAIPELAAYTTIRKEVNYGKNSRIDFVLEGKNLPPCYLEVKNVQLKRHLVAEFPDCVTVRGERHLQELAQLAQCGVRAIILYIVQREDCRGFAIAADIDRKYWLASENALLHGVQQLCYQCRITLEEITIDRFLPFYQPGLKNDTL